MFYSPLRYQVYRIVWIATLFSNIGTWIHTVTASLLMTDLSASPIMSTLVQAAAASPIFIFSIPGGVIADYYNRKSILISAHLFMSCLAMLMALITLSGRMCDWWLLMMTFLLNIGLAFNQPAWQAISSTLIPKEEIKPSAVLNNLSFNISRSIGPAIAGYFYASLGPVYLFSLNAISFLGVIWVFKTQVQIVSPIYSPSLRLLVEGSKNAFLFLKEYPRFRLIVLKAFFFFLLSSCLWATLPYLLIIYHHLSHEASGLIMSFGGMGAILCAFLLCYLRQFLNDDQLTTFSLLLTACVMFCISHNQYFILFCFLVFIFGFAWSLSISVFNGLLQSEFPLTIRSRLIGLYNVFFASAQAIGSLISGSFIEMFGVVATLETVAFIIFCIFLYYLTNPVVAEHGRI